MTRPLSVLLAEDDDPLRALLQELLAERGFRVHSAARGDEAVEVARTVEIDVSVLDFHLPGLSGVQVLRRIAIERRVTPSILISGEARREQIAEAAAFGLVEFLRKPLDLQRLRQSLDALVQIHATLQNGEFPDAAGRWQLPGLGLSAGRRLRRADGPEQRTPRTPRPDNAADPETPPGSPPDSSLGRPPSS